MIRHVPAGHGHAYLPARDQRTPIWPCAGEPVTVGVLASPDIAGLTVEVSADDGIEWVPMTRVEVADRDLGDGHLAAAAAADQAPPELTAFRAVIGAAGGSGGFRAGELVSYRIRTVDQRECTPWFQLPVGTWVDSDAVRADGAAEHLVPGSVQALLVGGQIRRVRFAVRLATEEHVVGLGERFHALDQRGFAVDAVVYEQYRHQGVRTYLPVPFAHVVGGTGWGLHVDTTQRVWFDVGCSAPDLLWVEALVDPAAPELPVHLWNGDPAQVLESFLAVVGRPASIPDWAFRPWISSNEWNTQQRVEAEVERSLAEGIAVGAVVIEAWSDEATMYLWRDATYQPRLDGGPFRLADFTFPPDGAWPDPVGMVDKLHALGVRVVLWQIPVIPDHDLDLPQLIADRAALIDGGHCVLEEDGRPYRNRGWWFPGALLPDFTSPETRRWWTDKRRYLVEEMGIDGFKTDGGEHAWGDELCFRDGTHGLQTNNRFPLLYAQAYHELLDSAGIDGLTFSRAGHAGAGSFPAHWAGDEESTWEAFRASLTAGLTAGASGVFAWGWDHGGFSGPLPSAELYLRTAAAACFCPIMQYHAEFNDHRIPSRDRTPWNVAEQSGDRDVLAVYRQLTELRERLLPYLAAQSALAVQRCVPLMRALFFDWPTDQRIWQFPLQYLLGDDLLVAPVTEPGATHWDVYLPDEPWVDVWTGVPVPGGGVVTREVPIGVIPVYCRASAWPSMRSVFA